MKLWETHWFESRWAAAFSLLHLTHFFFPLNCQIIWEGSLFADSRLHHVRVQWSITADSAGCTVQLLKGGATCILKPIVFFYRFYSLHHIAVLSRHSTPPSDSTATGEERGKKEECGWMRTSCRQTAFKVFPRLFFNSLAVKWVSIARIPALLRSVHGSERWVEDRQWMRLAMGLRYTFKDFTHTRAGEHTRTQTLRWVNNLLCS